MIEVRDVSKRYGDLVALAKTDMAFEKGTTTALLGTSGCGKSTILRIIVGLVQPDTGEVLLDGEKISSENLLSARHRMGYMIQDGGLFPHLSVFDNVSLLASHLKWPKEKMESRAEELAELTHLPKESLSRFPGQISGGQRQRAALMRALFLSPDVVLLDEPMGALDPIIRADLQRELRSIFEQLETTVVLVTHDVAEAGFLADTIALLSAGTIVQKGTLRELVKNPASPFVSEFFNAQRNPLEEVT